MSSKNTGDAWTGTTLLFVSHSMDQVRQVCNRAILLEHGHMIMDDDVEKVCSYFG